MAISVFCEWPGSLWARIGSAVVVAAGVLAPAITCGQVVQLPSWRVFAVETSVLVPDRGMAVLGGVNRAGSGTVLRRSPLLPLTPWAASGRGSSLASGGVSVSATIIDHREWDAAVLARAAEGRRAEPRSDPVAEQAAWITRHLRDTRTDVAGQSSVNRLKRPK